MKTASFLAVVAATAAITTVAAACAHAAPTSPAPEAPIALVKTVAGSVQIVRAGTSLPAVAGTALLVADRLVAAAASSAGIVFRDGTLLTLGANADLQVRDYVFEPKDAKYAFSAYLAKGSAVYASGKIGKIAPESVRVDTPTATVGVRGTRFIVEAEE